MFRSHTSSSRRRRQQLVALGVGTLLVVGLGLAPTAARAAAVERVVPASECTLLGASSESPGYPGPNDVDGTARAVLTDDMNEAWTTAYANGQASGPFPHWIAIDTGAVRTLAAAQYAMKPGIGQAKQYSVFVTSDPALAAAPGESWGAPVATGEFADSPGTTQTVRFPQPATGQYLKFEFGDSYHSGRIVAASLIRAVELADDTPPPATEVKTRTLSAGGVQVAVAEGFPQAVKYTVGDRTLDGQPRLLNSFRINNTLQQATTTLDSADTTTARWTSTVPGLDDLVITTSMTVSPMGTLVFTIDGIEGSAEPQVHTIAIPDHSLVSASTTAGTVQLARTQIDSDSTRTADRYIDVTAATAADSADVASPYAFVTAALSGGVYSNATPIRTQGVGGATDARLTTRIAADGDQRRASVASGSWVWAPEGVTDSRVTRFENPTATVVVAADVNADGEVTWQDAAIRLRDAIPAPLGADRVPERVVQRIPFNFGSENTNPFLKTLDNTMRLSQATDGLGQWALLKGYTSEGHDSANTDYGDNFNTRAGGLDDLNTLLTEGKRYNADFGVHVNATEVYPAAHAFSDARIAGQGLGWGWLNQSVGIDQKHDLGTGDVLTRFQQLRDAAPDLDSVYIDVYYSTGWLAEELADELHKMNFEVGSEWAYAFEGDSIWAHWANDKNYGGVNNKGINSDMVRFIANSQRDVWNVDPLLGGAVLKDFEGWTGQNDYYSYIAGIWTDNLPSKYIQHFELQSWTPGTSAKLTGDVDVRLEDGERVIRQGGVEVLRGGTYLLPWQSGADERTSPLQADKMYLYSKEGTANTPFTLTSSFGGNTVFEQFRLTDTGREKVGDVTAQNGRITVTAQAGIPYVLVPVGGPQPAAAEFGTFTGLSNPGFDAGTFTGYTVAGAATNELNAVGDRMAVFGADETTLSQRVTALRPGAIYDFGTYVEIGPQAERATTLRVQGDGVDAANAFSATPAENWVGSDPKHGTYMQRAEVSFVAPASGEVTVSVGAVAGAAAVRIDDWRVAERRSQTEEGNAVTAPESEAVAEGDGRRWDFEDNRGGWGPFVRGNAGGTGDARTSMSRLHQPYTQKDWKNANPPFAQTPLTGKAADDVLSGTYSLKSHDENDGLVYRSIPARLPFIPGHEYEVSFLHQTSKGGIYRWVLGTDDIEAGTSSVLRRQSIGEQHTTKRFSTTFTAGCDSTWVGLEKAGDSSGADFVLDDLVVADRGPSATEPTCALVEGTSDGELNAGAANRFVTTFTNQEDAAVTDVGMQLPELPAGWTARTLEENGNLFDTVAPGQTVQTVWLITPPADAMGASAELVVDAVYDTVDCAERSVRAWVGVSVATRAAVPLSGISATASSEEPDNDTEGSASYAIDNKPGTIWHTSWGGVAFPHSLTLDLGSEYAIDGFGYLPRASGGDNGRIKDYDVNISDDGQTWTKVADGAFQPASPTYQAVDFPVVKARWVQLVSKSSHNGQLFSAAAEVRVYGQVADVPAGFEPGVRERSTAVCTVAAPDPDVADQGSGQPDAASGDLAVTGGAALPIAAAVLGLGALALGIWLKRRRRAQA